MHAKETKSSTRLAQLAMGTGATSKEGLCNPTAQEKTAPSPVRLRDHSSTSRSSLAGRFFGLGSQGPSL